jgi:hypothetical protein
MKLRKKRADRNRAAINILGMILDMFFQVEY